MATRMKRWIMSWPAFFAALAWLALFSQTDQAAAIQGRLFPVVSELEVLSVTATRFRGRPATKISGSTTKLRDCDYRTTTWFLESDGRTAQVDAFFQDPPRVRTTGRQDWEALIVGVPPHRIGDMLGLIRHECGLFPVLTRVYEGENIRS